MRDDFHHVPKTRTALGWVQAAWGGAAAPLAPVPSVLPLVQEEAAGAAPAAGAGTAATHPQLADEGTRLLHRQLALLPHDALHGLQDVPGHGDVPADVDVASLLLQCFVHGLGQLLLQHVLHVFLGGEEKVGDELNYGFSAPSSGHALGAPAASSNTTTSWGGGWKRIAAPPTVMGKIWGQQQSFIWLLFVLLLDHPAC